MGDLHRGHFGEGGDGRHVGREESFFGMIERGACRGGVGEGRKAIGVGGRELIRQAIGNARANNSCS